MSEQPKRNWRQFHLSTAVLLVLFAGADLGANTLRRDKSPYA